MSSVACPFCELAPERIFHTGRLIFGIWDSFPVTPGHALLIPRRHIQSWNDATSQERLELTEALTSAMNAIQQKFPADGFNVGLNLGDAAGQTVPHLHLHVIPRRRGDVPNPRGGVRHIFPGKRDYEGSPASTGPNTATARSLVSGGEEDALLPHLVAELAKAKDTDIAVAFVLESGIARLEEHFRDLLRRGGRVRFLTGDYLDVTEPHALKRLLDLDGNIDRRVFETGASPSTYSERPFGTAFHPKGYLFHEDERGVAFVGSSNLSKIALSEGVEWNYRVVSSRDSAGFRDVIEAFERLFVHPATRPLTDEWIESYSRRRAAPQGAVADAIAVEAPPPPPEPHVIQREALAALEATRRAGNSAGLVVLATGLGKTWLSAFDTNRREYRRILFVAHREEILDQARKTFRSIRPDARLGLFTGSEKDREADVLFASIQTLGKQRHLDVFAPEEFDYIVVDEFHHASAATYRRLIGYFRPKFLLGLTATPERTDGGDLLGLCQENLVYRCDFAEGIRKGHLAPFHYFGVPDEVDYTNIPWRSSRFDEEALERAVATQSRAENALEQYRKRAGKRTLGFCVSQRHADFMANYFRQRDLRAMAVHAGSTSAPRAASLEQLGNGDLDVVFAVDMFNEGVDLPELDTVMMLRPTESRVLWLQQFGRGLRKALGKDHLTVVDYIGNHRTFLLKPRTLLQLGSSDEETREALERVQKGQFDLPPGCEVTYELEAIDLLAGLLKTEKEGVLKRFYEDFRELHGIRPRAAEVFREGYNLRTLRPRYGSWLKFVRSMGDLSMEESGALDESGEFLDILETTEMTRSYKMLLILAMLNRDHLPGEIEISELSTEVAALVSRSAALKDEFGPAATDLVQMRTLLDKNPIAAFVGARGTGGRPYFSFENGLLRTLIPSAPANRMALQELTRELADWRLAEYLERPKARPGAPAAGVLLSVSHANGRPILFLPERASNPQIPEGWAPVSVDGQTYEANFVKVALNVVRRLGEEANQLPDILRRWFGPDAGLPGTQHRVLLEVTEVGLSLVPQGRRDAVVQLWRSYMRNEIPKLFGLTFSSSLWQQGFVNAGGQLFLLVTLDKESHAEQFQYQDRFLSPTRFQWQSQNRTTQASRHGQMIKDHKAQGIPVHLFVRARGKSVGGSASPFIYCGDIDFQSWTGEKPITVEWRLQEPVPAPLREVLRVPSD